MKPKAKGPSIPPDRRETVRQEIVDLLAEENLTAKEVSGLIGVGEKEVLDHLEHVKAALHRALVVTPSRCLECGFSFKKRDRLSKPGKCPVCRSERISDPSFTLG